MAGKVTKIAYWLDGRTDALQKLTMEYPAGNRIVRAAILFENQGWKEKDPTVDVSPIQQVLGPDNRLLPAYRTYELQDHRNG